MNDPQVPASRRPRALIESALATAIDRVGPVLFFDPDRLRSLLRQATTEAPQEVEMLLAALAEEVPQHLLAAHGDDELAALLPRLVARVMKNRKAERGPALWSVRTWAHALALPTTGLDDAPVATTPGAPGAMDFAAVVKPRVEAAPRKPPSPVPQPRPVKAVVPPSARPPAPAPRAPVEANVLTPIDAPTVASITAPTVVSPPVVPPADRTLDIVDALSDFVPLDDAARLAEPEPLVAPVPELVPGTFGADASATMAAAFDAPGRDDLPRDEEPRVEPMRAMREPARPMIDSRSDPASRPGPLRVRNLAIAAVVIVVVAAAAIAAWLWPFGVPGGTASSSVAGKMTATPTQTPLAEPVVTVAPAPAPTPAQEAAPTGQANPPPVAQAPAAAVVEAPAPVVAASPAPQRVTPAPATSSAAVAASATEAAAAPGITRIDVPAVTVGKSFSIALAVDGDPRRVASIERRVVSSDATWTSETVTSAASTLARTRSGGFMLPFRPIDRASTSTLQFVAIDRNGVRGPARRTTLVVAAAAPSASSGANATPSSATSTECTPSTCGVVVSLREVELRTGATSYETIVRLDDRGIQTITQPTRWAVGTRVRSNGERLTAIDN